MCNFEVGGRAFGPVVLGHVDCIVRVQAKSVARSMFVILKPFGGSWH